MWPLELLANFRVQLLEAALLATALAIILKARVALVVCALAALANGAVVAPSFGGSQPAPPKGAPTLTLGHLNAQNGDIDVAGLRRYLTATRPAVFVILDPSVATANALQSDAAGYQVQAVHRPGAEFALAIALARVPFHGVRHPLDPAFPNSSLEGVVDLGTTPIAVLFLHTESPFTPGRSAHRNRALAAAARWSRSIRLPHVVEGDLNATPWSAVFDTLLRNGRLHNSLVGFGIQASWPAGFAPGRIPIDHALLSAGLTTVERGTGPSFGSEHRSLHITIARISAPTSSGAASDR